MSGMKKIFLKNTLSKPLSLESETKYLSLSGKVCSKGIVFHFKFQVVTSGIIWMETEVKLSS